MEPRVLLVLTNSRSFLYFGGDIINIFISCSSHIEIDEKYIKDADYIANALSKNNDLVIGIAGCKGVPGKVLNNFKENNRNIEIVTLKIYNEDQDKFNYANFNYVDTTFDRNKIIYDKSDVLLMLPGGTGTLAEVLSFLEEKRTKNDNKDIILYNKDNYYIKLIEIINNYVKNNFNDSNIFDYIKVFNDVSDLLRYMEDNYECR